MVLNYQAFFNIFYKNKIDFCITACYHIHMNIYTSENFIKESIKKEVELSQRLKERLKYHSLKGRELFCYEIPRLCEVFYRNDKAKELQSLDITKCKIDDVPWMEINTSHYGGLFINANAIFGNKVYCHVGECHFSAYSFVYKSKFPCKLNFGKINPYDMGDGLFHSIATFNVENKEFVFDGANYMVMSKDLYFKLFKFKPIQVLEKETIKQDYKNFARPTLKSNEGYMLGKSNMVNRRFNAFGFITYLYDRNDFLENSDNQLQNYTSVVRDYKKFLGEIKDKDRQM